MASEKFEIIILNIRSAKTSWEHENTKSSFFPAYIQKWY